MYKNCPKLLLRLWNILQVFRRRRRISEQWIVAEGVWIPKKENSTQLDQLRIMRSRQRRTCVGKAVPTFKENHRLCQSWGAAKPCQKYICRHPNLCKRLAAVGGPQPKFPSHIAVTTVRPDIVLVYEYTRQIVLMELTVPWEGRLEEAFERKLYKICRTGQ